MIAKYESMTDDVFGYMYNSIQIVESDEQIAKEVISKFPTYVCYFKCDYEMIYEFLFQTCRAIRLTRDICLNGEIVQK